MGEEILVDEVSKSEAASAAGETVHLKSGDSLNEKMEVESNGVDDVQDNGKELEIVKTYVGKVVKDNEDRQDGKGEGESKTEAVEVEVAGEENREGPVQEKECEQKADKDVDVNGVEDEKMTDHEEKTEEEVEESEEKKKEEQPVEGSKGENNADEVDGGKEMKKQEEVEDNKEVEIAEKVDETKEEIKNLNELGGSREEKYTDEIEMGEEEKNEEVSGESQEKEYNGEKLASNKEMKVSKKRLRRKSAGRRRDRKKKQGDVVEEEETAKKEKGTEAKKNRKEKKEEKDEKELDRTPIMDRPVREKKSVERLVSIIEKDAHKEFKIEKGPGTPLKDIPNVASQLRRRNDETLKLLHNLLFGRRCKAFEIRGHISRFSGYVWHDNEEKQRNKVKEKFDKCTKEKLLEICDVLDIQVLRVSIKKEELVIKLIDFLVAPYASTTVVFSEEPTKAQKRKRMVKQRSSWSAKRSVKSLKKNEDSSKRKSGRPPSDSDNALEENEADEPDDEIETENGIPEKSDDEMADPSESEEEDVSEESGDETRKRKGKAKLSGKKDSSGKAKNKKAVTVPKASQSKAADDDDRRVSSKKNEIRMKKSLNLTKSSGKKDAKGKGKLKDVKPSDGELRNAICEILKEVDFNTATFTDILKQLVQQFDMDLNTRKSSIKQMIQEELTKLADNADDDEEDDEGVAEKEEVDTGKAESAAAAEVTEVKA